MRGIFSSVEPHYGESRGTFQGEENHPGWNHRNTGCSKMIALLGDSEKGRFILNLGMHIFLSKEINNNQKHYITKKVLGEKIG